MRSSSFRAKLILICLISIFVFSLMACSYVPPQELKVDISYSGKEVVLSQYGRLTITLESDNPSGSVWIEKPNIRDKYILELKDHKYTPAESPIPGSSGSEVWIFEAPNAGKSSFSLEYRAPYPEALIYKTFDLTVRVMKK